MKTYNCIILDDEELDRLMVTSFVKRFPFLNIIGICEDADAASEMLLHHSIDILFLDIDMPGTNGLEFRKQALNVPVCIYISSHPEYALETFELDTLDFIVKPVKFDRFSQAIERVEKYMELRQKAGLFESTIGGDSVFIKDGHKQVKVNLHEILYLEGLKEYTKIVTENGNHYVLSSIGNLLKEATFEKFVRIHRSFAVQKLFIQSVNTHDIMLRNNTSIPLGRSFKDNLNALLL